MAKCLLMFVLLVLSAIGCNESDLQNNTDKPILSTSANVFAKMFYDNPISAEPYIKKVVAIKGVVDRIEPKEKINLVHMKTETFPIIFGFPSKSGLGVTKRGQTETIKGIVEGYADGFVVFSNCQIVK